MKKPNIFRLAVAFVLCLTMLLPAAQPVSAVESGACGDGLLWELNAGTLIITGTGAMTDYRSGELPPWYAYRDDIVRLSVSEGVTSIGNFAFYECKDITVVQLPASVRSIGDFAFASCERLTSVSMGGSVAKIGRGAFYNCYALSSLRLPYGLSSLGDQAFYRCESLRSVSVPANVRQMGTLVFAYCKELVRAEIYAPLTELPAWTFYGCEQLADVYLASTIGNIENYGFKKCESLSTVFFEGSDEKKEQLQAQIEEDVALFGVCGNVTSDEMPDKTTSGKYEEGNGTVTQTNTTVLQEESFAMDCVVERTYPTASDTKGSYTAQLYLTVQQNAAWEAASGELQGTLTEINNSYSVLADNESTAVTVFMENGVSVSDTFLDGLSGRDVSLVMVSTDGARWEIDCRDLAASSAQGDTGAGKSYSHTIKEAPADVCESLGTDDCYRLIFAEAAEQNAKVLVQLPTGTAVNTNAFLYQVEEDGSYTRLQATAVDQNGYAHLYIASVNKDAEYIIGLDVPGESTKDVIIPDTMLGSDLASAIQRLEKVKYVHMGRVSSWGVGMGSLTWILIGVLLGTTAVVGGIMFTWNKMKKKNAQQSKK